MEKLDEVITTCSNEGDSKLSQKVTQMRSQSLTRTHSNGFAHKDGARLSFKTGLPCLAEATFQVGADFTTTHTMGEVGKLENGMTVETT
eukprot:4772973-Amphidinium_carterae.1